MKKRNDLEDAVDYTIPPKIEEPTEFRVGDICEAFGIECVVKVIKDADKTEYPMKVKFIGNIGHTLFCKDGKLHSFHKTPSLKLIRRAEVPKPEEKKIYEWQYVCKISNGSYGITTWHFINKKEMKKEHGEENAKYAKRLARSKRERE